MLLSMSANPQKITIRLWFTAVHGSRAVFLYAGKEKAPYETRLGSVEDQSIYDLLIVTFFLFVHQLYVAFYFGLLVKETVNDPKKFRHGSIGY